MRIVFLLIISIFFFSSCWELNEDLSTDEKENYDEMFLVFRAGLSGIISWREELNVGLRHKKMISDRKYFVATSQDSLENELLELNREICTQVITINHFSNATLSRIKETIKALREVRLPFQKYMRLLQMESYIRTNLINSFDQKNQNLLVLMTLIHDYFNKERSNHSYRMDKRMKHLEKLLFVQNNEKEVYISPGTMIESSTDIQVEIFDKNGSLFFLKQFTDVDSVLLPLEKENVIIKVVYTQHLGFVEYIKIGRIEDSILVKIVNKEKILSIGEWMEKRVDDLLETSFIYNYNPFKRIKLISNKLRFEASEAYTKKDLIENIQVLYDAYYLGSGMEGGVVQDSTDNRIHKDDQTIFRAFARDFGAIKEVSSYFYYSWMYRMIYHFKVKASYCGRPPENATFSLLKFDLDSTSLILYTGDLFLLNDFRNTMVFSYGNWKKKL